MNQEQIQKFPETKNLEVSKYKRHCPICNKEIIYASQSGYCRARKKNSSCASCVKIGNNWTWNKGKNLPSHIRDRIVKAGIENLKKVHDRPRTEQHKENLRNSLRGRKLSEEHKTKIRLGVIKARSKNFKLYPNYSKQACQLFEDINRELGWNGQHAENGGEFFIKELGYWVDYYEPNLNIVIEFDDKSHKYRKEKDILRQNQITKFLGCKFYRITENDNWRDIIK